MMIGELDYGDLFHPDDSASTNKLPYDIFSMIFFLGFLVVMPILIMNLLVRFCEICMFLPFSKKKKPLRQKRKRPQKQTNKQNEAVSTDVTDELMQ